MPAVSKLEELREAVADFAVVSLDLPLEPAALSSARTSLDEAGLLLLGETHGVAENPLIIRDLMRALQITSLALEWPTELTPVVESFLHSGALSDHVQLWLGDGRITAGHLRVLQDLHGTGSLRLTLFDPPFDGIPDADMWANRDKAMATQLLGSGAAGVPTLVVAGGAHTPTVLGPYGLPLGAHLAASRPAVRPVHIRYGAGGYYNLAPCRFSPPPGVPHRKGLYSTGDGLVAGLPTAHEAVVPHREW